MNEEARKLRNKTRLEECFPTFAKRVGAVIKEMEKRGFRPRIQEAWRSPKDQLEAFESGHSKLKFGFHNVTGPHDEKQSLAVDMLDDNNPLNPGRRYLLNLADCARAQKLITGILWGLPQALADGVDKAIKDKQFNADVKIGWDPTHIEPTDVTVAQAKDGKRPA
jgi:hypothetical protein